MLVLTRKVGETLRISEDVEVRILSAGGGRTRIGISAPAGIRIRRAELPPAEDTARRVAARRLPSRRSPIPRQWRTFHEH